jgi:hypothetical protein
VTQPDSDASNTGPNHSRQIAGSTCIVHNVKGTYPMSGMDMVPPTMVTQGTVCLVKNGPGQADYTAFYHAAGKHASLRAAAMCSQTTRYEW